MEGQGRKEERKEGRKEGRKEEREEGARKEGARKEGRKYLESMNKSEQHSWHIIINSYVGLDTLTAIPRYNDSASTASSNHEVAVTRHTVQIC